MPVADDSFCRCNPAHACAPSRPLALGKRGPNCGKLYQLSRRRSFWEKERKSAEASQLARGKFCVRIREIPEPSYIAKTRIEQFPISHPINKHNVSLRERYRLQRLIARSISRASSSHSASPRTRFPAAYIPIHERVFARVFTTLTCPAVVSRNDEVAATAINTWPVVNAPRAPGLCLFGPAFPPTPPPRSRAPLPRFSFPAFRSEIPEPKPTPRKRAKEPPHRRPVV